MKTKNLIILIVLIVLGVGGFLVYKNIYQPKVGKEEIRPSYKYVTEKPTGWFKTGQEADIVLYATGFNESGGPLVLNHPGKVAIDGKRLIVSDTWNNRVLIWSEIPIRSNQPPDLILGQYDFDSNMARLGGDGLNWPMAVATDGERLLVGDAYNDRVLIWNGFPTRNGQLADLVLGAPDFDTWPNYMERKTSRDPKTRIYWPWDIWTNGTKLVVGSTGGGGALVWNSFPTKNNQPADIVIGTEDFSTRFMDTSGMPNYNPLLRIGGPRSIASDGKHLIIGAYQPPLAYVWKEFPTKDGVPADFVLEVEDAGGVFGLELSNGKLFLANNQQIYIWNEFPENDKKEDLRVGTRDPGLSDFQFSGPYDVTTDGKRLFVADYNNNRILIFNEIPTKSGAKADIILGQPNFKTNIFESRNSCGGSGIYSNGEQLFLACDFNRQIQIYNHLPDESKASADVVISASWLGGVSQITTAGEKMIAANREAGRILIWNKIPKRDNQPPDVILGVSTKLEQWRNGKGNIGMNNPSGVTMDGKRLFVADTENNRILIWNEIPTKNQTPADIVLGQPDFESTEPGRGLDGLESPKQISTDGERLVVADGSNKILVWKSIPTRNRQSADFEIKIINHSAPLDWTGVPQYARFALPAGVYVYNDSLFVADTGNHRILIWSKFPESELDEPDIVLGQKDFASNYPSNTKDGLFLPAHLSFDGNFLWVGETKWSNRLLRFSVQP